MNYMEDSDVYRKYPYLTHWYNKLWLSEQLGYSCGPSGVPPTASGWYVVRPIMNLLGMGIGAEKVWIDKDDYTQVRPGYFWCEWFDGRQFSVTYEWQGSWIPVSCWEGMKGEDNLSKFHRWTKASHYPELGPTFDELSIVEKINAEFIEDRLIEVHLRTSPDPSYDELIPVWKGQEKMIDIHTKMGYSYILDYDDGGGFLEPARIGFLVKN